MPERTDSMLSILDSRRYATLATLNEDGSIHLTPVWYLFEEGRFYVESLASDRKVRNLVARPGATIIVDARDLAHERWVYAAGTATIIDGEASRAINTKIARRYLTEQGLEDPGVGPVFAAAVDVTICLTPGVWRAWNLQELDEQFFSGRLARTPERWFRALDH